MQKLINVNGINYDVTTVTGTYSQHKSRIINSPWYINAWTDEKMERDREELAKKVAEKFGTPPNARNVYVYLFEDEEGEGKTGGPFFVTRPGSGGACGCALLIIWAWQVGCCWRTRPQNTPRQW